MELEDFIECVLYVSDQHLEEELWMEELALLLDEEKADEFKLLCLSRNKINILN